jgi:hypothetical protein
MDAETLDGNAQRNATQLNRNRNRSRNSKKTQCHTQQEKMTCRQKEERPPGLISHRRQRITARKMEAGNRERVAGPASARRTFPQKASSRLPL